MDDGGFDRVNSQRRREAAYRKTREELIRQVEQATTLDGLKDLLIRVIEVAVK